MIPLSERIAALLPVAAGNPIAMINLAELLRKDGQADRAGDLAREALALAPGNGEIAIRGRAFLTNNIPGWHFVIIRDSLRNAAYEQALRQTIKPGDRVLEIGAGTGILAMMAARAGAAQVITCEMNPTIAQAARENIARNGLSDRVRVVAKHSDNLDVEADMGGRADVLVSEIVSNNLLGEDVLPAHENAMRKLLRPGAAVIPARGAVRVALAEDTGDHEDIVGEIDGYDLSAFNGLRAPIRPMNVGSAKLRLRSEPASLFNFDFANAAYCAPGRQSIACRSFGGRVTGVIQWMSLDMAPGIAYENQPEHGRKSCWAALYYPLPAPIETARGREIQIHGSHDRHKVLIWADAGAAG